MKGGIKKGNSINIIGWKQIISDVSAIPIQPKGYSTVEEIASKTGKSESTVRNVLGALRREGKIDCMQARTRDNKIAWVYKD